MVSIFGDNRVASDHPEWVQQGPDGVPATRHARYFDWDAICPSHDAVFETGMQWVKDALAASNQSIIRLDDVTYAREGYCQCTACLARTRQLGGTWESARAARLVEFVGLVTELTPHVEMTLYPDPIPGHLFSRFGLDIGRLAPLVETFVVPLYDMHYATTYWLEILAQGFQEMLPGRWLVELYGLGVQEEALLHAAQVVSAYADGVVIAYDNQLDKLKRIAARLFA